MPRIASEAPFGWLAVLFAGGLIAGALLWRRDVVLGRGSAAPSSRSQQPTPPAPPAVPPAPTPTPSGPVPVYTADSWLSYVQPLAERAGIPLAYVQQWAKIESGWQPCAVGNPFASFDGVNPLEAGLAQLYGPDDYQALKLDPSALRTYCAPRYLDPTTGRMAFSQHHARALAPHEMMLQAAALVGKIALSAKQADKVLGGTWDRTGRDFWTFVKLHGHGLPNLGPDVIALLGHVPASWAEFRAAASSPEMLAYLKAHDPATYGHAEAIPAALLNAEKTAAVVAPGAKRVA